MQLKKLQLKFVGESSRLTTDRQRSFTFISTERDFGVLLEILCPLTKDQNRNTGYLQHHLYCAGGVWSVGVYCMLGMFFFYSKKCLWPVCRSPCCSTGTVQDVTQQTSAYMKDASKPFFCWQCKLSSCGSSANSSTSYLGAFNSFLAL